MNSRRWPILVTIALVAFVPAQARERKLPPSDPELGSLAVKIKTIGPTKLSASSPASAVVFVRSDADTGLLQKTDVMASDFNDNNQVYLFNVPPGKYVAVGAYSDAVGRSVPAQSAYVDSTSIAA